MGMTTTPNMGGPYTPRPDLGPGVGFGVGLPDPNYDPSMDQTNTMPPVNGLPTVGMGGGKGGVNPGADYLSYATSPQFASDYQNQSNQIANQIMSQFQTPVQSGGPLANSRTALANNAYAPMAQANAQQFNAQTSNNINNLQQQAANSLINLPPQGPQIGFGMPPQGYGTPTSNMGAPTPAPAPVNRFAPPNAPGVRPSVVPTTNRQMTPMQQAQFGGAGQLGSARANLMAGRAPVSNAVASRSPSAIAARQVKAPVRRTK